jgi:uncharacterized protein with HEPN domain
MRKDDFIRLSHMLDSANEILQFAKGKSRADLAQQRILALALVKSLEIIGEAASKLSEETKQKHRQIPWNGIIAMRNHLIHAYFDIDYDRVWDTVQSDIPSLITSLQPIVEIEKLPYQDRRNT